ncbi:hypothetical protein HF263_26800 [Rhizobium leguminosarum]|uniref:Uncharacterized protein n=1 Tax=Rhizobium leguminosarum TaxID=384 RepID=A0A7K3VSY2_RHILE|nr:hypothetical protein [Rhizobium leguminosarum]MBY2994872.1 hypothetical protein [Rhizobium leguminosarum]MBY3059643.1 hypothetical protein [Rhizobium leguminosarum]NEK19231.1 hypothetical protein [Rhizobium leguminosarum]
MKDERIESKLRASLVSETPLRVSGILVLFCLAERGVQHQVQSTGSIRAFHRERSPPVVWGLRESSEDWKVRRRPTAMPSYGGQSYATAARTAASRINDRVCELNTARMGLAASKRFMIEPEPEICWRTEGRLSTSAALDCLVHNNGREPIRNLQSFPDSPVASVSALSPR